MPRALRLEEVGFYHIVNRGVERRRVFLDVEDHEKFLEILEDSGEVYDFKIHSFCLMNNHYHLLLQTFDENLSLIMRQINSRYSIYFNNKYKRVGPLWQGRFKSYFVYDENYLVSLVKYIESNPIKANVTKKIGQFTWAMSSKKTLLTCLDFELIESIDFTKDLSDKELQNLEDIYNAKFKIKGKKAKIVEKKELYSYFEEYEREVAIAKAIQDGYLQTHIAAYLKLSAVSISKIYKKYKQKVKLFEKLKEKGIFWSYSKELIYEKVEKDLFIEHLLKYADFDENVLGFNLFGKSIMKKVWEKKMMREEKFIKTNLMIARVFFDMDVESDYFKRMKNARFEKLKLLAS